MTRTERRLLALESALPPARPAAADADLARRRRALWASAVAYAIELGGDPWPFEPEPTGDVFESVRQYVGEQTGADGSFPG